MIEVLSATEKAQSIPNKEQAKYNIDQLNYLLLLLTLKWQRKLRLSQYVGLVGFQKISTIFWLICSLASSFGTSLPPSVLIWSTWHFPFRPSPTWTSKVTGSNCLVISPGIQVGPGRKFFTIAFCANTKILTLACRLCCHFCTACFSCTHLSTSEWSKSSLVQTSHPRNSEHGMSRVSHVA